MAGDWIKMLIGLRDCPEVIGISSYLEADPDLVVGKLHRLWSWANTQTVDGNARGVTAVWVDRYVECDGFADALKRVGWLTQDNGTLCLPGFEKHNGQTAKQRALTARRVALHRKDKRNAPTVTREEKRRVEKKSKGESYSAEFEEFYQAYPKKKSKGDAFKAWKQTTGLRPSTSELLAVIGRLSMTDEWKKERGKFVPYPASWLRAHGWNDEIEVSVPEEAPHCSCGRLLQEQESIDAGLCKSCRLEAGRL